MPTGGLGATLKAESRDTTTNKRSLLHDQLSRVQAKEDAANRAVAQLQTIATKLEITKDSAAAPELSSWKILIGTCATLLVSTSADQCQIPLHRRKTGCSTLSVQGETLEPVNPAC